MWKPRGFWLAACAALVLLFERATAQANAAPDYRARFFDEVLTPAQTDWTHRFNAYEKTSYTVDKAELIGLLPAVARARNQTLLGALVIGPTGFMWSYHVVTFVREGTGVRVVAVVFPHGRLVHKSTRLITVDEYEDISRHLFGMDGVESVRNAAELWRAFKRRAARDRVGLSGEWQANFVFANYTGGGVVFAKLDRDLHDALGSVVNPLLQSLNATYTHGQRPSFPPKRPDRSYAVWLLADVTAESVPELNHALAPYGFAGFDDTLVGFGLGGDVMVWRRLRLGYDITFAMRLAEHRSLDIDAALSALRFSPRVGIELIEYGGFSLFPTLGLRWEERRLNLGAGTLLSRDTDLTLERHSLLAELGIGVEYYLARTLFDGFAVGTRLGFVRGLAESDFDPRSLVGNPETAGRGAFVSLYLGLSGRAW